MLEWLKAIDLSDVGSWSSIASFFLTVWILATVRKLRSHYLFKARVPQLQSDLASKTSQLSEYLNDYRSFRDDLVVLLGQMEVLLKNLKKKAPREARKSIKALISEIDTTSNSTVMTETKARSIYTNSMKLADELQYLQQDQEWE